jgi:hypothetical protein
MKYHKMNKLKIWLRKFTNIALGIATKCAKFMWALRLRNSLILAVPMIMVGIAYSNAKAPDEGWYMG